MLALPFPDLALDTDYTILAADAGLAGEFDEVTFGYDPAFLTPNLSYDASNAYLTIAQTASFASVAQTPNQKAAAMGAESTGAGHGVWDAVIVLGADDARSAFDQLSGEIHASVQTALVDENRLVQENIAARLRGAMTGPRGGADNTAGARDETADKSGFWGQVLGAASSWPGDGNAAALNRSLAGLLTGWDGLHAGWRLGVTAGAGWAHFSSPDAAQGTSDTHYLGTYAGTRRGNLQFHAGSTYAWHQIRTQRTAQYGSSRDDLSASYPGNTTQLFAEVSRAIARGVHTLVPFAQVSWMQSHTRGFAEQGGDAALRGDASRLQATLATLGVRAATEFFLGDRTGTAHGMLGWRQAFGDSAPSQTLRFSAGDPFTVTGVPAAANGVVLRLGLDVPVSPAVTLGVTYDGRFGHAPDHRLAFSLSGGF